MARDDEFNPKLGALGDAGKTSAPRYLGRVLAAANLARGGAARKGARSTFSGSRTGRGHGVGRVLASRSWQGGLHARRVIVKASIVRMAGRGAAAASAHMRYLQRDGTTREGERGTLYGRDEDALDGKAFGERCAGDRRQFRFIVSPEDGDQYDDLKPLTRRLMARMEQDLGTKLDWVAVDHFNTGHPHSHILVRGKDEQGEGLVIARDYMTRGLRERACELVDLDLGPRTMREVETVLKAEVEQERLTSLDRALLRSAGPDREVAVSGGSAFYQALHVGRLNKLARMGLAEPAGEGRFRLAPDLAETLKRMGERGDIIRTMQREFSRAGAERSAIDQVIHDPARADAPALIGRVMAHGLSDEHADRHYLIVDALDGRSHYVDAGQGKDLALAGDHLRVGAIVRIEGARAALRPSDRVIAEVAAVHGGRYDVELHLRHDPTATESFARTHVRRLEAMRRGGGAVMREPSGQWIITPDHLERVLAWEEKQVQDRPVTITSLSTQPLERMVDVEAATWIDRALVEKGSGPLSGDVASVRDAGFGHDLRDAIDRRRQWLVAQGFAEEGATGFSKGMLEALQRRELLKVAGQLSGELGLSFEEARQGQRIEGIYRRPVELVSGRFAVIERARDFTLVPWKPVLERRAGQGVSGIMRGDEVNWSVGRGRGGPNIS